MYVWQYLHMLNHGDVFDLAVSVAEIDPNPKKHAVKIYPRQMEWISLVYFILALA